MGEKITISYMSEAMESLEGEFVIRRLMTDEANMILDLCRKRNPRTGQDLGIEETKYGKYRIALAIENCPIQSGNLPWKDLDLAKRAELIGKRLEEDMFLKLLAFTKKMSRMDPETQDLF